MADAQVTILKAYNTTSAKLSSLPFRNGNLIFARDIKRIYLDYAGQRIEYASIITLETESDRLAILAPSEGYYFVIETNIFWLYKEKWIQVTSGNISPIYFGDVTTFPDKGQSKRLYVSDNGIYKYDDEKNEYALVASASYWNTVED